MDIAPKGILEFADLRHCEAIINSKSLNQNFKDKFGSKENLTIKFSQLAELRNSIRHVRDVSEITKKEGEAAILWFKQILK